MDGVLEQIINVLTNPPGSLAYFLVVVFCITSALQVILMNLRHSSFAHTSRLVTGVIILLAAQTLLFIVSAFAWQSPSIAHIVLPPCDRSLTLFSLLLVGWLWTYPTPNHTIDISFVIMVSLVIVLGIFTYLFWSSQPTPGAFNSSQFDLIWNIVALVLMSIAGLALFVEKPAWWLLGFYFLLVNLIGYIAHFVTAVPTADLTASVRLTELITFPVLPLLSQRLLQTSTIQDKGKAWPLITRIEETTLINTDLQNHLSTSNPTVANLAEIDALKNQLDLSMRALNEAQETIYQLKNENETLTQKVGMMGRIIPTTPSPSSQSTSVQSVARILNYPLFNIKANAALINADGVGVLGSLQRNFLNEIIHLSDKAYHLINTLINEQNIPDKSDRLFEKTDLNAGIDAAIATMNASIRAKNITLRLDAPEITPQMSISQNVLEQILIQLLQNAVQASPAEETISLEVEEKENDEGIPSLIIQISNSGIGIAPKNLDKIFSTTKITPEPKFRGVGSLSSLQLAKTMIDIYGGKIWLESKGKQTTFYISIPL